QPAGQPLTRRHVVHEPHVIDLPRRQRRALITVENGVHDRTGVRYVHHTHSVRQLVGPQAGVTRPRRVDLDVNPLQGAVHVAGRVPGYPHLRPHGIRRRPLYVDVSLFGAVGFREADFVTEVRLPALQFLPNTLRPCASPPPEAPSPSPYAPRRAASPSAPARRSTKTSVRRRPRPPASVPTVQRRGRRRCLLA